ncbi:MAG TPA: ABC transporter substrate-binding protein, partial [Terriglobales bacterium]|nr:ABC transporter substrate-binding protein [Terriglobales bacterium]
MRRIFSLLAAALLLISFAGCADKETPAQHNLEEAAKKGELRLPLLTLPYTFNPCVVDEGDPALVQNLFSRLFRVTGTGELAGDLVSEWDYPEGATDIAMTLRSGSIRWHDGQALTGADIKFTLEGIKAQQGVLAEQLAGIESVEVTSDTQFVIHLTRYEPFLLYTLAQDGASILPKHLYEGQENWVTAPAATAPVGSGPFKFVERVEGTSITLEKFAGYYGGSPRTDKLIFKLYPSADDALESFEAGELDVLDCGMPMTKAAEYAAADDYKLVTTDDASRISLVFNVTGGVFFGNPELRKAILYALDREA